MCNLVQRPAQDALWRVPKTLLRAWLQMVIVRAQFAMDLAFGNHLILLKKSVPGAIFLERQGAAVLRQR